VLGDGSPAGERVVYSLTREPDAAAELAAISAFRDVTVAQAARQQSRVFENEGDEQTPFALLFRATVKPPPSNIMLMSKNAVICGIEHAGGD
jgi:hypothetical protein